MSKRIYVRYLLMTAHGVKLGKREYMYHAPSQLDVPLHGTIVKIKTARGLTQPIALVYAPLRVHCLVLSETVGATYLAIFP